jgi:phospholipid/cholesterol/gamma-HCH transport system substrate-binding protein
MTGSKLNLTLVGASVLAALITLVLALAFLAGRTGDTDRYYTVYSNVAGLKFGSQVMFEGYPVGQVESIEPIQEGNQTRFKVDLSVSQGWKIPDDSVARSVAPGVLAPQTISIATGKSQNMLKPGAMIPPAGGADLLSSISSAAGSFDELTDTGLLPLLENLNRQVSLLGEILEKDLRPMVRDFGTIAGATAEHWPEIAGNAEAATASLAQTSERINQFLTPQRVTAVDRLVDNLTRTSESVRNASAELDKVMKASGGDLQQGLEDFRYTMETLSRYSDPVGQSMENTARNFQDFSRQLRQNPSLLLRPPEREAGTAPEKAK